jgi:predicted ester cyclase
MAQELRSHLAVGQRFYLTGIEGDHALGGRLWENQWFGERRSMSTIPPAHRIELSPAVRAILEADNQQSQFLKQYLRYLEALLAPDSAGLDSVVTPDGRCHELEAMGFPRGLEGLKVFRRQVNAAIPDEHISITAVRFEGDDIIEADMVMDATQTGEFLGIPATGRRIRFDVHERCRFVDGKLAERWAVVDLEDVKRQLAGPIQ